MAVIHIPDSFLAAKLANLATNTLKCVLIDISTYAQATGAAIIDTTDGNKIIAVDDFQATVASSGGTYTVAPITLKFTHF